jgi:hypothetical protein
LKGIIYELIYNQYLQMLFEKEYSVLEGNVQDQYDFSGLLAAVYSIHFTSYENVTVKSLFLQ